MVNPLLGHKPPNLLTDEELALLKETGERIAGDFTDDVQPADLQTIAEHAMGFARHARTAPFGEHPSDAYRTDQYQCHLEELRRIAEPAYDMARTRVSDCERELATHHRGVQQPRLETWLPSLAIATLTLTIAPTLHDQFFVGVGDRLIALALAFAFAAVVGGFVTWNILGFSSLFGRRTVMNWTGLFGGIGIGIGMGLLRVAYATTTAEYVFALALTIMEISIVIALERVATDLRRQHTEYRSEQETLAPYKAEVDAARQELARREEYKRHLEDGIAAHVAYVEWRSLRKADDIAPRAQSEILKGYQTKVRFNLDRRRGAIRRVA